MTTRFRALPGLLLLLAAGCAATPEPAAVAPARPEPTVVGGTRLTGPEFRQAVFGNTLDRSLPNGARLLMHVAADGEQRLRIVGTNGQRATDRGRIAINGDEICTSWDRIDAGRQNCFAYFRLGESLVAIEMSGAMTPTRFNLLPGNPEGL
ncbi:hypothetical protein [Roseomonas sp. HF4]|uniref:hypothetical protein n=1 Tax=Roseomonas sp. HF4 TaxID=2562313 RepID=UPI0010C094C6|nr:hypothetical protein [Roseomonas sp. HF4]